MKKTLFLFLLISSNFLFAQIPVLNSYPSSTKIIYLDFDGEVVNDFWWFNGQTINSQSPGLSTAEIREVFDIVAEDFSPFNINVTTDEARYNAAAFRSKMRVIITPTSYWMLGQNNAASFQSFNSIMNNGTPCFVFTDRLSGDANSIGQECSKAVGITMGLNTQILYDGNCNVISNPNMGAGQWAPIMGTPQNKLQTTWYNGKTYSCNASEDNISVMRNTANITMRPKTGLVNHTLSSSAQLSAVLQPEQIDTIILTVPAHSQVNINGVSGGNTDLRIRLNNIVYEDPATLDAIINTILTAGTYTLEVFGKAEYGNTGQYTLSITSTPAVILASDDNAINVRNNMVYWNIRMPEFRSVNIQRSFDGIHFSDYFHSDRATGNFQYSPNGRTYFRNKVVKLSGQVNYSQIVMMNVQNAPYRIYDLSGRLISINKMPSVKGVYIIYQNGTSEYLIYQ